ncbi:IS256 family transposase [Gulosibacter chungangensis]|uniref:IS256 family transposase n=2 Tax=Gulosibacter chungangensis TaxID=979746 RepID=A0A7J5BAG3_9MICO|nr:transposase [Gulosibacter chungangensis]KAB1642748.1 IS256 family transposase [Gulosibacter chungangensis]
MAAWQTLSSRIHEHGNWSFPSPQYCVVLGPRTHPPVETRHHQIMLDGIYIGSWCLLIAITQEQQVLAWQWCARESKAAWQALLERIPAPTVVICDGGAGIHAALRRVWPDTRIQRCLFHVQMGIRRSLTLNPRTLVGRRLRQLSLDLSDVHTIDDAIVWQQHLDAWWQAHGPLTKERTYSRNGQWWYTHDRLRKAWNLLHNLNTKGHLFTHLEHHTARTTSALEGGINNGIRTALRAHRGMSEAHMKRAAEWFLTLHEIPLEQALDFAKQQPANPEPTFVAEESIGPVFYDKGLDAAERLWLRQGWAGRG